MNIDQLLNPNVMNQPLSGAVMAGIVYVMMNVLLNPIVVAVMGQTSPWQNTVSRLAGYAAAYGLASLNYYAHNPATLSTALSMLVAAGVIYGLAMAAYHSGDLTSTIQSILANGLTLSTVQPQAPQPPTANDSSTTAASSSQTRPAGLAGNIAVETPPTGVQLHVNPVSVLQQTPSSDSTMVVTPTD